MRLAADHNLDNAIIQGLIDRKPDLDVVRVQEVGLAAAPDNEILDWAAREGRVVITQDVSTMIQEANSRILLSLEMPGLFVVPVGASISQVVDDLLL
jgi:predicted nuclease of predicted toxin-antitoxin system